MMNGREKSDAAIVAMKPTNKAGQPRHGGDGRTWEQCFLDDLSLK